MTSPEANDNASRSAIATSPPARRPDPRSDGYVTAHGIHVTRRYHSANARPTASNVAARAKLLHVILVAEGPSAAGKTTWLSQHDQELVIAELGRVEPPQEPPDVQARFWADVNADRWHRAVTVEATHGSALCDSDPLKLHYDYCRARAGVVAWSLFEAGVNACGAAIAEQRLGIADLILCDIPDVDTLDARRQRDATRTRRNFALHRDLGPALREWYATLDRLDPGRVAWAFPATVPRADVRDRYDVKLFNRWMRELPSRPRLSEFRVR